MAERGRFVVYCGRNARPVMPLGPFYVKGCSLHGFVMFKRLRPNSAPVPRISIAGLPQGRFSR